MPRGDESNGHYHALNRGNSRAEIFRKEEDYTAFERILGEGLSKYDGTDPTAVVALAHPPIVELGRARE